MPARFRTEGAGASASRNTARILTAVRAGRLYDGQYVTRREFQARPAADLLSLKVVDDATQNATAHKLLGADYQTLVDANYSADEGSRRAERARECVLGARIATTNAAIVMRRGNDLIGLLVFDAKNNVRMRYYTNVPAWKKNVPKTIQAWRQLDKTLPVDVMRDRRAEQSKPPGASSFYVPAPAPQRIPRAQLRQHRMTGPVAPRRATPARPGARSRGCRPTSSSAAAGSRARARCRSR